MNFDLLRPFDLEAAKGAVLLDCDGGNYNYGLSGLSGGKITDMILCKSGITGGKE